MILDYTSNASGLPFTQQVFHKFSAELRWSPNMEVAIVLSGNIKIHYRNHSRDFFTHDIFFFQPFETSSIISSSGDAKVLSLSIDSDYINRLCSEISGISMQQCHIGADLSNPVYVSICRDLSTIIFNNLKNETCSKLKLLSAITNILITIIETYGIKNPVNVSREYNLDRIVNILHYINEHFSEKITVNDIAAHIGVHPQYFSSFFSKSFHTSFVDYLTTYRVNNSLARLLYTDDSILNIALDNGFSNHKTYSAAFKKIYNITPTEYRKEYLSSIPEVNILTLDSDDADYGIFSYFRQFISGDGDNTSPQHTMQRRQTISFDALELSKNGTERFQVHILSAGRAYACLRSDVQAQIIQAVSDFDYDYLRLRDIFSDDLYIYYEKNGQAFYSWQSLDNVFDFILDKGLKPFPEIGFMPEQLAKKRQHAGWQYHPNVSAPKSMSAWQELIRNFLRHYIDRYGLEEVRTWKFDFWTSPDLNIRFAYWNESQEDFFDFYKATYDAFMDVDKELSLGTPNFSTLSGYPWYESFFRYCYVNKIYPSYVSVHIYGCELRSGADYESDNAFNDVDASMFSISNQNFVAQQLTLLHQIMNRNGFRTLDVIVSDWNLSFMPKDLIRDTCYMGPYIAHTIFNTHSQVKGLAFWSMSDIHEDFYAENTLFRGGPGLLDFHGLKKA